MALQLDNIWQDIMKGGNQWGECFIQASLRNEHSYFQTKVFFHLQSQMKHWRENKGTVKPEIGIAEE